MKKKSYYAKTGWISRTLALLVLAISAFGMARLYILGSRAFSTVTLSERRMLSRDIDLDSTDYDNNYEERPISVFGRLRTADDYPLLDVVTNNTADPAFYGLVGPVSSIDMDGTNYVLSAYRAQLFPQIHWTPISGIAPTDATVTLTISRSLQEAVYDKMEALRIDGCVAAYDYRTGDILATVSTPGYCGTDLPGSHINKCLYATTPGSTQKLLTLVLLEAQGIDTAALTLTCTGSYDLQNDQPSIDCTGVHGTINGRTAIGVSCNCWFAQAIRLLDLPTAKETLRDLGISSTGACGETLPIGLLHADVSSVQLGDRWDFSSIWNLIGQDAALSSPFQMCMLSAAMASSATGDPAVMPRLTTEETPQPIPYPDQYGDALRRAWSTWTDGFDACYSPDLYGPYCTAAKTGTAAGLGDGTETHKLLAAVSQELGVALYIVNENYNDNHATPYELCRFVFDEIAASR